MASGGEFEIHESKFVWMMRRAALNDDFSTRTLYSPTCEFDDGKISKIWGMAMIWSFI